MNPFAIAVFGHGRIPNDIMLVGESPGAVEYEKFRPFVGPSGIEQEWYLSAHDLSSRFWYKTNVSKTFIPGNPDPDDSLISFWSPWLEDEIRECFPKLIIAVGKIAAMWFLHKRRDMETIHGIPFPIDVSGVRAIVIPIYHPAFGLRNPDIKGTIAWDYSIIATAVRLAQRMSRESFYAHYAAQTPVNEIPNPQYTKLSGKDFVAAMRPYEDNLLGAPLEFGLDTEGWTDYPWPQWLQISPEPGVSYILKSGSKNNGFNLAIDKLQSYVNRGSTVVAHQAGSPSGAMIDTQICRILGLELRDACLDDTMYAAYLLRVLSRGLKPLCFRLAGMEMSNYEGIIGDIGRAKQIDYLRRALATNWTKPDAYPERQSDGTWKIKSPKSMSVLIEGVLRDIDSGKMLKDGPTDPERRWRKFPKRSRREIIAKMGMFPRGTLDDVDLTLANSYAGADSDGVLRIKPRLLHELDSLGLIPIYNQAMRFLPVVEDMQREGMPARRSKFNSLQSYILREKLKMQREINEINGRPINVNSPKQMIPALRRMSITFRKRTKSGAPSIGKKSLEYAKHFSRFVLLSFQIKEHGKIESTYCRPAIDIADNKGVDGSDGNDAFVVNSFFQAAKLTSRRLSTEKPSLLNQPTRTKIGRMVRDCYVVPPGREFGAWDFNSQELRVAAHIARDPLLIDIFSSCQYCSKDPTTRDRCRKSPEGKHKIRDPHTQAAVRIFGIREEDVKKFEHRLPAKTATFGVINGLSGPGLVDQFLMYIPPDEHGVHPWAKEDDCERLIREILTKVYKGIGEAIQDTERHLRTIGHVRDIFADDRPGMLRYLPNGRSERPRERAEAVRQGFNHKVQGTAAQMTQASITWIDPKIRELQRSGLDVRWHLAVHDELILSYPPKRRKQIGKIILEGMTKHHGVKLCVPVEADEEFAQSWGELKKD